LLSVTDKVFASQLNDLLRICGKLSYLSNKAKLIRRAFYDFPISDFCSPSAKTCRVEARSEGNVLYHFLDTFHFPGTPTIEWLDGYLKERKELLSKWVANKWHQVSPKTYLELFKEWMFLAIVRRKFDFNVFLTDEEFDNVVEVFNVCPGEFHFWECITNLISKIWFFELIVELSNNSRDHVAAINSLIEEELFALQTDALLNRIFDDIEKINGNVGFPVYASEGEIVFVRSFEADEISKGFLLDTKAEWFLTLSGLLSEKGYSLRYQWPFGTAIKGYPVDICLSFKSHTFKGDGLPDYF